MALWNWLWYDFVSDQGTKYKVKINADTPPPTTTGSPRETLAASDGFKLEYDGESQESFKPVVGSKVTFTLIYGTEEKNEGFAVFNNELFVTESLITNIASHESDARFTVEIRKDPDDTDTLFWCGVLLPEQITIANEPYPRHLKLTATDDIANLDYVDYEEFFAAESFTNAVIKILRQTRMADLYWDADDLFISFQDFITTTSAVNAGNPCAYSYHRFISSDMLIPTSGGGNRPRPAGEVLRYIADAFMASIYQSDGRWWVIPRLQTAITGVAYSLWNFNRGGTALNATAQTLLDFYSITSVSTTDRILSGSSDSYLHPARQVLREYKFSGTLPVVNTGANLRPFADLVSGSPYGEPVFGFPEQTVFTWYLATALQQTGDATLTGDERVGRYKIVLEVKCGDYYLIKNHVAQGTEPFQLGSLTVSVFQPSFPSVFSQSGYEWTLTPSNLELWTNIVDYRNGNSIGGVYSLNLPELPADSSGLDITFIETIAYDKEGNTSTAFSDARNADLAAQARLTMFVFQQQGPQDTIFFEATNDNNARDVIELEPALFGDRLSGNYTRGSILLNDNETYTTSEWRRTGSTDEFFLNELLVTLHAQFRARSRETRRLKLLCTNVRNYYNRPFYDSRSWVPTRFVFNAGRDEYDIEMITMFIQGAPTVIDYNPGGGGGITPPGVPNELPSEIAGFAQGSGSTQETVALTTTKIFELQPPDVGGIVLKNAVGDTDKVTYIAPALKNATVTLPVAFHWFLKASTRLTATTERFFTLNAQSNVAAIDFYCEWIAAFSGRASGIWVRSSAAATITAGVYKNGTTLDGDTETFTAGQTLFLAFGGSATFDEGDALAISIESSVQPNDVNVSVVLLAE